MSSRYVSIAVVDIERFGRRTDVIQEHLRAALRDLFLGALTEAGVDRATQVLGVIDRGDGLAVLVDPSVPKETLTGPLVERIVEGLRRYNAQSSPSGQMRWRMSLHAGEVSQDDHNWVGRDLNSACRMVELPVLREVLTLAPAADLVVGLSESWHDAVVGSGRIDGSPYRAEPFEIKELVSRIHVRVPGLATPPGTKPASPAAPIPAPVGPTLAAGARNSTFNFRDVRGDLVNGDKNVGVEDRPHHG